MHEARIKEIKDELKRLDKSDRQAKRDLNEEEPITVGEVARAVIGGAAIVAGMHGAEEAGKYAGEFKYREPTGKIMQANSNEKTTNAPGFTVPPDANLTNLVKEAQKTPVPTGETALQRAVRLDAEKRAALEAAAKGMGVSTSQSAVPNIPLELDPASNTNAAPKIAAPGSVSKVPISPDMKRGGTDLLTKYPTREQAEALKKLAEQKEEEAKKLDLLLNPPLQPKIPSALETTISEVDKKLADKEAEIKKVKARLDAMTAAYEAAMSAPAAPVKPKTKLEIDREYVAEIKAKWEKLAAAGEKQPQKFFLPGQLTEYMLARDRVERADAEEARKQKQP